MSDRTSGSRRAAELRDQSGPTFRTPGRRGCRGLTLVEIMIAVTLLLFGLMGFTQAILRAVASNEVTRESAIAGEAARQMLETLQAAPFDDVFRLYNADPGDD